MALHCYIITPLCDKQLAASAKLCCTFGDRRWLKGTYNTSFVPAALASCRFQITVKDLVSYNQSTEWNSTTVSKRSDPKVCTSENVLIRVIFTFDSTKKSYSNVRKEILPGIFSRLWNKQTMINLKQVKKYIVWFLKHTFLN